MSPMTKRPTSITVISWIFIVVGAMNVVTCAITFAAMGDDPMVKDLMAKNLLPVPVQYALMVLGLAVMLACGVGMLNGGNWARWLYTIWSAVGLVIALATSPLPLMLIPGAIFYGLIVFFLFRPVAAQYFLAEAKSDATSP